MTPREIALALAVTTVVVDAATEQKERLRAELLAALDGVGADSVRAELRDGTRVAKSTLTVPGAKPTVLDEAALVEHVQQSSPHNIETRVTIRPAYQKVLLDRLVEGPDGCAVDPDTGEVVPGVAFRKGGSYISTRFDKGGRDAVIDAIRSGDLTLDVSTPLPAIGA